MKKIIRNVWGGTFWVYDCSKVQLPGYVYNIAHSLLVKPVAQVPYIGTSYKKAQAAAIKAGLVMS